MVIRHGFLVQVVLCAGLLLAKQSLAAATACDMPCLNQGVCHQKTQQQGQPQQQQRHYCQCPTGYTGGYCEISLILCDTVDTTKICSSSGNPCQRAVNDFGVEFFHCECNMADSDLSLPYAQKFCEHASTVFCGNGKNSVVNGGQGGGKNDRRGSFCTNGGRCKQETAANKGRLHAGCDCPVGFAGAHCEDNVNAAANQYKTSSTLQLPRQHGRRRRWLSVLTFMGIMLLFLGGGLAYLVHHGNKGRVPKRKRGTAEMRARIPRQKPQQQQLRASSHHSAPVSEIEIM